MTFSAIEDLRLSNAETDVDVDDGRQEIRFLTDHEGWGFRLEEKEARALRDWLNKALQDGAVAAHNP